jgi:hypothetical protein
MTSDTSHIRNIIAQTVASFLFSLLCLPSQLLVLVIRCAYRSIGLNKLHFVPVSEAHKGCYVYHNVNNAQTTGNNLIKLIKSALKFYKRINLLPLQLQQKMLSSTSQVRMLENHFKTYLKNESQWIPFTRTSIF